MTTTATLPPPIPSHPSRPSRDTASASPHTRLKRLAGDCIRTGLDWVLGDHGSAYRRLLEISHEIEALKALLTREHGDAVLAALSPSAEPAPAEEPYDCEVTAHPAGGYALFWPREKRLTGKYPFREDAAADAERNFYRVKAHG
ncbi:hypothetical protein ASA1KI_21040 [Opitutales bacterium ASA1]|uniref:hypothetical protein n=1 Tax=Congregicoccus parvus TaxID=3081749 RepID=UPI002B291404|nr:hypothetical protein ASA1KI_21040 [Opitutales bacterium ASA1]